MRKWTSNDVFKTVTIMHVERPKSVQPMPESAERVFQGVLFDVYQWQQELFDGSKATYEKLKRQDAVVVVGVTEDGGFLVTLQEQPGQKQYACLASGHIEAGETPHQAAVRELLEETGYQAAEWELLRADQPIREIDWALYHFIARGCKRVTDIQQEAGEHIQLLQVDFDGFVDFCRRPDFTERLLQVHVMDALLNPEKLARFKAQLLPGADDNVQGAQPTQTDVSRERVVSEHS